MSKLRTTELSLLKKNINDGESYYASAQGSKVSDQQN